VGNSKSAKATIDTSKNFYSTESVLDDFRMFLKKLATAAATEAYAETLEENIADATLMVTTFREKFKDKFSNLLNNDVFGVYGKNEDGLNILDQGFIKEQITFNRPGKISIKYESFDDDNYPLVLKGVQVTLVDEMGFENTLTTNMTFRANLPETDLLDDSEDFNYDIDHFVVISRGSITAGINTSGLSGETLEKLYASANIKGNIYANRNINIFTKTLERGAALSDWVKFNSHYIIAGGDVNVNGRVSVDPISIGSETLTTAVYTDKAELWAKNVKLSFTDAEMQTGSGSGVALDTDVYLKGSLELNGRKSKYIAKNGNYYGFSSQDAPYYVPTYSTSGEKNIVSSTKPRSSGIVVNGFSSTLDMSDLTSVNLAGVAYTALPIPNAVGNKSVYDFYNGNTEETDNVYLYTQGNSVTFRALQALYLIPGELINGVGHNPMKESEFASITASNIKVPTSISGLLGNPKYKEHHVQYINGENYVYLFWNFSDVNNAITYFNTVTQASTKTNPESYYGLFGKQMGILGSEGEIKLPSGSGLNTYGYAITYNKTTQTFAKDKASSYSGDVLSGLNGMYLGRYSTLGTNGTESDPNLVDRMFKNKFDSSHLAYQKFDDILPADPWSSYIDADGSMVTFDEVGEGDPRPVTYRLITGPNVQLGTVGGHSESADWKVATPQSDVTYIIITPGNVELRYSGEFRGMIIAGGEVLINPGTAGLNMECLGDIYRTATKTKNGSVTPGTRDKVSEFDALLAAAPNDSDIDNANTRLRRIFNVADTSLHTDGDGNGFIEIIDDGWLLN